MIRITVILMSLALSSCAKHHTYHYDKTSTPKTWYTNKKINNILITNTHYHKLWWEYFDDTNLKYLIKLSIENNLDYKTALTKIEYTQADSISKQSILYPQISLQENSQTYKNDIFGRKNVTRFNNATLDSSWEIDLFGTNRNLAKASLRSLKSQEERKNYLLISLVAEIINLYIDYKATARTLELTKIIDNAEQIKLKLAQAKFEQGIINELDFNEQQENVISKKIKIQDLVSRLAQIEFRIENLCGQLPGSLSKKLEGSKMPVFNQKILINSPIKIITTRPDIVAAKYNLLSATSVTKSSLSKQFPSINIHAAFGYQESNIGASPQIWSLASGIILPLINFGKIQSEINMNKSLEKEAFLNYQKSIYDALEDVENSLLYYKSNLENYNDSKKITNIRHRNLQLIKHKYLAKVDSYYDVLESQISFNNSEIDTCKKLAVLNQSLVRLSKSIGHKVV